MPRRSRFQPTCRRWRLLDWLRSRGGGYASALEDLSVIRVAVNQEFAAPDHAVADGDEIALFPPVTGGAPS